MSIVRDPIYQQLNSELRQMVREFAPGDKFLSEREISEKYQVSRATANKALSNLVVEGVLNLRKGVGTFVSNDALNYDLRSLVSFTHKARSAGKCPTTELLTMQSVTAGQLDDDQQAQLQTHAESPLWFVKRLRLADNMPVILERRYILAEYCPDLTADQLTGSLYELWTSELGLDIAGADETIQAVNISADDAKILKVSPDAAALQVSSVGYISGEKPLWIERTIYRGDAYTFRNRTGRIKMPRPAVGKFTDI